MENEGKALNLLSQIMSRRAMVTTAAAGAAAPAIFQHAHAAALKNSGATHLIERVADGAIPLPNTNGGVGTVTIKYFHFEGSTEPNILLHYSIPPRASEGVHTHHLGDKKAGSFDEFYFILAGEGMMEVADERFRVVPGDHVFTPNGVPHGIVNPSEDAVLELFLIAVKR